MVSRHNGREASQKCSKAAVDDNRRDAMSHSNIKICHGKCGGETRRD